MNLYSFKLIKQHFYIFWQPQLTMVTVVAKPVAISRAFSPGHITGIVITPTNKCDYLYAGSTGSGFSIDQGITTTVEVLKSQIPNYQISINSKIEDINVSKWVVKKYLGLLDRPYHIRIKHETTIPIGFGLGSSGAGALSLSYALNDALDTKLTRYEVGQIAHQADIACKTGLGTVIAEFSGGFEIRDTIGAPGIGSIEKIDLKYHKAVVLCMSPLSTKDFLCDHKSLANPLGEKMLTELKISKDVNEFLRMSYIFAHKLGLTEGRCKMPLQQLKSKGIEAGVALFGETIFTIVPLDKVNYVKRCLSDFKGILIVCNIDNTGARVL
jgi:pantoate kinase